MNVVSDQRKQEITDILGFIDRKQSSIWGERAAINISQSSIKRYKQHIHEQVEIIRKKILISNAFFGDIRDWFFTIATPAEQERFEALAEYWRGLEQNLRDHQGQLVAVFEERLIGRGITKHYVCSLHADKESLAPSPQPHYYPHGFCLGIIDGELSFDFARRQSFLPMAEYYRYRIGETPVFMSGRLILPEQLLGPAVPLSDSSLLSAFFPTTLKQEECRYTLAVGNEEVEKSAVAFQFCGVCKQAETILRAKKRAREAQQ